MESAVGIYEIIAIVQLLIHWAETSLRPLVHSVAPLLEDQRPMEKY